MLLDHKKLLPTVAHNNLAVQNWVEKYFREEVLGINSIATAEAKRGDLKKFCIFYQHLNGNLDLSIWTALDTAKFIKELHHQGYKPTSISRILMTLKSFSRFLREHGHILRLPTKGIKGPTLVDPPPVNLTDTEVHRLRKVAYKLVLSENSKYSQSFRNYAILELLLNTGIRATEVSILKLEQLQGKKLVNVKCKGNKFRNILIKKSVVDILKEYISGPRVSGTDFIFSSYSGQPLTRRTVHRIIQSIGEAAKIKSWPHLLRHVHAKRCRDKHGDCFTAKRLGHSSTRYIERYAGHTEAEESKMIEELEL